jgi:prolyl-tRNA synthetase
MLGDNYSRALNATFQDSEGESRFFVMGCYGIGVSRTVAAAIEQNHDANGIIFPAPIAPFQVTILLLDLKSDEVRSAAAELYDELQRADLEVLLDDRDERPGVKFKDADLIGIPWRIMVGKRFAKDGMVEIKRRLDGHMVEVPLDQAATEVRRMVAEEQEQLRQQLAGVHPAG